MKKFTVLALLLSFGLFTAGCNKPADKKPETPAAAPAGDAPATPPADTPPAETK
jgi:hypothetical protein